jgi:acyl carrier protein phosphodiesterase
MNYLAHAYLSFGDAGILTGNMISDFVKGKRKFELPDRIQQGIQLHRKIDVYTDDHLANKELMLIFRPYYGLYSGAIMDVLHDHFLANDHHYFNESTLLEFSLDVYAKLVDHEQYFPEKFAGMFPYMQRQNWLFNYRLMDGVRSSLGGLYRRARYMKDPAKAFELFETHYETLQAGFHEFFPDLREMAQASFLDLGR